jgi:glutathione peroxidase-family protein
MRRAAHYCGLTATVMNFTKFIIGRNGAIVARFEPNADPESPEVTAAIERELAKKGE